MRREADRPTARLEIQTLKVRQVVEDYRGGRLVIPEFQREYVWKPSRALRLLDSIYRGHPISVLLLWTSHVEARARRRDPRPTRSNLVSWLIDGQQRVITMSRILSGDEGIDVVFNPEEDQFRLANAATRRDVNWFRVSELFDDDLSGLNQLQHLVAAQLAIPHHLAERPGPIVSPEYTGTTV